MDVQMQRPLDQVSEARSHPKGFSHSTQTRGAFSQSPEACHFGVDKPLPTFKHLRRTTGERDCTSHQQPQPAGDDYGCPDGFGYNQYPEGLNKNDNEPKAGSESSLIHALSVDEIHASSVDGIHALSVDVSDSQLSNREISRARVGRNLFYDRPELYQNRWRQQFVAKFPNSKLARNLF